MDGRSLVPQLRAEPPAWDRPILLQNGPGGQALYQAVRTAQYVYVEYQNGDRELYDMASDPDQLRNLHGDPELASTEAVLIETLGRLRTCAGPTCG